MSKRKADPDRERIYTAADLDRCAVEESNRWRVYEIHSVWPTGRRGPRWSSYCPTAFRDLASGKLITESPRFAALLAKRVGWGNGNKPTRDYRDQMVFFDPAVAVELANMIRTKARWEHAFKTRQTYGFTDATGLDAKCQKVAPLVRVVEVEMRERRRLIERATDADGGVEAGYFGGLT